ncbi:hypothetical protein [Plantactinospora sp. GCM10030261]|uniref:hypothetical protein n=1 Tax=Plantactinospora sp. GCM10030261 TaxID=3273420 RepID=UPI00361DD80E
MRVTSWRCAPEVSIPAAAPIAPPGHVNRTGTAGRTDAHRVGQPPPPRNFRRYAVRADLNGPSGATGPPANGGHFW